VVKAKALPGQVLVHNLQGGVRIVGKIILLDDNGTQSGIRSRWAQVYSIGEGVTDVKEGEWLLIKHGQWTRGFKMFDENNKSFFLWKVNYPDGVLVVSDEPEGETFAAESIIKSESLKRDM
jgi:hypothetical protein